MKGGKRGKRRTKWEYKKPKLLKIPTIMMINGGIHFIFTDFYVMVDGDMQKKYNIIRKHYPNNLKQAL